MMSTLMYLTVFMMSLKEYNFMNSIICLNTQSICLVALIPLISKIIFKMKFVSLTDKDHKIYKYLFMFLMLMLNIIFIVNDSLIFILCLELCVYPMMMLIINFSKDKDKMGSMILMFSMNICGSIPFIIYMGMMKFLVQSEFTNLENLSMNFIDSSLIYFLYVLLLISKMPVMFLHFWLNKAHVSASGSSSMILASLMLKMGTFGLYKYHYNFLIPSSKIVSITISYTIVSLLIFSLIMTRFFDIKYMMACSSIMHMAMILPMMNISKSIGIISSMFMMVSHGLISCMMFYYVTIVYENSLNRSILMNKSMESASKLMSYMFMILMILNLGVPPFMNFYSEMMSLMTLYLCSNYSSYILVLIMIIPILFVFLICSKMLFGKKMIKSNMITSKKLINDMFIVFFSLMSFPLMN